MGSAALDATGGAPSPTRILFLGDIVGYGPDPAACIQWVRANATVAVQGNHDYGLANNRLRGNADRGSRSGPGYPRACLEGAPPNDIGYLRDSAAAEDGDAGGTHFHLVHGTPLDPMYGKANLIFSRQTVLREMIAGIEADVILMGNTHIPAIRQLDDKVLVNPGSLGQPRYGVPDPTYAIWEDGEVRIRHLHISHDRTIEKLGLLPLEKDVIDDCSRF